MAQHHHSGFLDGRAEAEAVELYTQTGRGPEKPLAVLNQPRQAGWQGKRLGLGEGDQCKPPARQMSGKEQPGQLSFVILQLERQNIPGPGQEVGVSTLPGDRRAQSERPE